MEILAMLLMVAGLIGVFVGWIWFLVVAFQESILWGLGCLIFPIFSLVFVVMHWDKANRPFLLQLASVVPMFAGIFLSGGMEGGMDGGPGIF